MKNQEPQRLTEALTGFIPGFEEVGSYIAGNLVPGTGDRIELVNPVTGNTFLRYRDAGTAVLAEATEASMEGYEVWRKVLPSTRGRIMQGVAQRLRREIEPLARLEALSVGKPIRDCRIEVNRVCEMFEYYAGWTDKLHGEVIPVPTSHLNYTRHEPFGVVLQITPWNAPIFTCGWQVAPAIAMGNAVLLKPSELTPLSSIVVAKLAEEAGLPPGLVSVLSGCGHTVGQAAIAHDLVKKVVFVGSLENGIKTAEAAARRVVPCVLELGGKSANIVFSDADLTGASLGSQAAIFAGAGQSCVAGSRLLIQRPVYDDFVKRIAHGANQLRLGDPLSDETEVGPINNLRQYRRVRGMIDSSVAAGAKIASALDGDIPGTGYFIAPTVLSNVNNQMEIARREVFGPVVSAIPFDTEEEAVSIANDSEFGLAGAVWTGDVGRGHRVAAQVNAGTFWINSYRTLHVASPFGGCNRSGYGRSSGIEALLEYTRTKSVWVETAAAPDSMFGHM